MPIPPFVALALVGTLMGGCITSTRGAPERLYPANQELLSIANDIEAARKADYWTMDDDSRAVFRNELVSARMYAIDLQYTEFENALLRERQRVGFWATTATLGLNGAVPFVSSSFDKNLLSGAAEFVTGTNAAYNREILLASTIQVIINQMRAGRDDVKSRILLKRNKAIRDYPLGDALADVEAYHRAGTLASGVLEATKTTSEDAQRAEETKAAIEISGVATDQSYVSLRAYLYPDGVNPSDERIEKIRGILRARNEKRPLWLILQDPSAADVRAEVLREALRTN